MTEHNDARLALLTLWVRSLNPAVQAIEPASADASFRRYFRITDAQGKTTIAMDAPPPQENCRPFVRIAQLMSEAGVFAPQVLSADLERGFLLLTDLGKQTYLDVIDPNNQTQARGLFKDATAALIKWQLATRPNTLPLYDAAILQRELSLFPDWYVAKHRQKVLPANLQKAWEEVCQNLIARALAQPKVYVHRDFMPRNLMVTTPNPGVLDFQDALEGPISYDAISLYRDAFLSWDESFVIDGLIRYWEAAKKVGLPVNPAFDEFYKDAEWMGLQRHLKVLGIFARINYRDGKPKYLADTPRFIKYARDVASRYIALTPLREILDFVEDAAPAQTGVTF